MEWPESLELTLDGIAQGGEGVGRWEGRVVFAAGGLPGERVRVRLSQAHEAYARGDVTEVLEASAERVAPQVPGADHMPWQHVDYQAQLRFKRQILAEQLAKIGGLNEVEVGPTVPASREWGYRNSARLHVAAGQVGYYAAGSRDLQPIERDPLLLPVLNELLAAFRATYSGDATVDEVIVRASETYGYAVAALRGQGDLVGLARRWSEQAPALAGVALPRGAYGSDDLTEELGGVVFRLRPTTFFQVNLAAAERLLRLAIDGLAPGGQGRLLDLYCGAGAFALPLAAHAAAVVGVEEHAASVADGEASAQENGIGNARFVAGPVERVIETLEGPFEGAVLDPPRRGCHPKALEGLLRLAPERIVYVSCHPATLARDLKILVAGGYRLERVQPVDLFPQTPHVESVSLLVRQPRQE